MAAMRDIGGLRPLLTVIGVLILITGAEIIKAEEGQSVTLPVTYTGDPREITWRKDGNKVGEIILKPPGAPHMYILGDRASINKTSGSLTINNLIKGDSGEYTAEVIQDGGKINTIRMKLIVGETETIRAEEGQNITLPVTYTGNAILITWKKDGKPVVDMRLKPLNITFTLLEDRASINNITGSLTIRNLTYGDSGFYTAEVIQDGGKINTNRTELIVEEKPKGSSDSSTGYIVGIIIAVLIIIILILGLLYCFRKHKRIVLKGPVTMSNLPDSGDPPQTERTGHHSETARLQSEE